ncbi:hypothetical protein LTR35_013847 [Friedmanniomyces endolithicus]|uniref:Uncharacterized protein n=1 Tax=Friedmanniomyces endolithicus TaxID=329885 RepID=A0AAN6FEC4_9PEZI|nr:hypothetical protein LTR35_013847 [Friedmanniomyces endolithicus]KAK0275886.1 hypothetical protein LTS00_014814 [Friedmanniomyces endolithicus]KAK0313254.1 hypothetical protein LTR82_013488 [Friedmanniomyces endolithicus]KAK0987892.1 hypothetical protein LTR54_013032 [Friedmanniomyces endolithicus]
MTEATYFHSTLYKFNGHARKDVIMRFNEAMNDISARCWYDTNSDTFELKSPGGIGAVADETLAGVIAKYVDDEVAMAERDNREPNIERFPDSGFDEMFTNAAPETATHSAPPLQSTLALPNLTLHLINTEDSSPALKLFRLSELPAGLLERVLANPGDPAQKKMIEMGYTCRAVCTSGSGRGEDVFNGRIGQPLPALSQEEEAAFLGQARFQTLIGTSADTEAEPEPEPEREHEPEVRQWRFKEGHEVNFRQWLNGMGKTELFDPDERDILIPQDAARMLVSDQLPALGRLRVAKGAQALAAESEYDSGREEPSTSKLPSFSALLGAKATGDSESESSENDLGEAFSESDKTTQGGKANFRSLLARNGTPQTPTSRNDGKSRHRAPVPLPPVLHLESVTPIRPLSVDESIPIRSAQTSDDTESMPRASQHLHRPQSFGKEWAAVDNIGLTARPDSQALWQVEHPSKRKTPRKRRIQLVTPSLQALAPDTTGDGASMYSGSANKLSEFISQFPDGHGAIALRNIRGDAAETGGSSDTPLWEHIVVRAQPPLGTLVDDTAPVSDGEPVALPPGLGPPPGRRPIRDNVTEWLQHSVQTERHLNSIEDPPGSKQPRSLGFLPGMLVLRPAAREHSSPMEQPDDDDPIVERRQSPMDERTRKKDTMGQRAPNRGKGKGSVKVKGKIQLPLPDPVPPPKKPKVSEKSKVSKPEAGAATKRSKAFPPCDVQAAAEPHDSLSPSDDPQFDHRQKLENLVFASLNYHPDVSMEIRFGMVLFAYMEKSIRKGSFNSSSFMPNAVQATMVCLRLTTSTADAKHILELPDGDSPNHAHSYYEFRVRDDAGNRRGILSSSDATVRPSDDSDVIGKAYMHCPYRTWDAQYVLRGPASDFAKEAVEQLLASITTGGTLPLLYAKIPHAFAVEGVLVKREFHRVFREGIRIVVTECQELYVQSLNEPSANLRAWCDDRDVMIGKQRLWWEAKIVAERVDDVGEIKELVDKMVWGMDDVGAGNKGPWMPSLMERMEEMAPQPSIW